MIEWAVFLVFFALTVKQTWQLGYQSGWSALETELNEFLDHRRYTDSTDDRPERWAA